MSLDTPKDKATEFHGPGDVTGGVGLHDTRLKDAAVVTAPINAQHTAVTAVAVHGEQASKEIAGKQEGGDIKHLEREFEKVQATVGEMGTTIKKLATHYNAAHPDKPVPLSPEPPTGDKKIHGDKHAAVAAPDKKPNPDSTLPHSSVHHIAQVAGGDLKANPTIIPSR